MRTTMLCLVLLALSGCATLSKMSTPASQPYVQAAVDVAVATAIGNDPPSQRVRAAQIKSIASQVLVVDEGAVQPLTQIEAIVNAKVAALHLPLGDVAAAQILMALLSATVQQQIQSLSTQGAVTNATQVAVAQILNDVIVATSAYGV